LTIHPSAFLRTAILATGAALSADIAVAATTDNFTLFGEVTNSRVHDRDSLRNLPAANRNVGADVYTGATLWDVLNDAGLSHDPAVHNDLLSRVVVATGADGYKATFSLGEIHPNFGGAGQPHLVAYDINHEPLTFNGFARMVSPDDNRRGRFVSNLASIKVIDTAPGALTLLGGISDAFTVSGEFKQQGTVTAADFAHFDQVVREVTYFSGPNQVTNTFTGVGLWDFLTDRGMATDNLLHKALLVTGSDGYQVAFALGELSPSFGDPAELAMIALLDGDDGFARLVLPGDHRGGRFVSNIVDMKLIDVTAMVAPVPLPAGAVLALTGIGALFGLGGLRRRKRA